MNKSSFLFWTFFAGIFIPTTLSIGVGSLRLTVCRIALIIFLVSSLEYVSKLCKPSLKNPAFLLLLYSFWATLALAVNHGFFAKLESSGVYFIEVLGPFAITLMYCNSFEKIKRIVLIYVICVCFTLLVTLPETLTNVNWLQKILGGRYSSGMEPRLGLHRSFGTFDHPILQGVVASTAVGFAWFLGRYPLFFSVVLAAITSVSSGAILSILIQFMLIGWERFSRAIKSRWGLLIAIIILGYSSIEVISNRSAMNAIVSHLTFSPQTAFWRMAIWDYGMDNVWSSPFFGIGFHDWIRPAWMHSSSIDAFWLVSMVRYGIPAFMMYAGAFLIVIYKLYKLRLDDKQRISIRRGWLTGMIGLAISCCTVHLWNNAFVFINFYLGLGAAMIVVFSKELRLKKQSESLEKT